jgi:hypothetical protein
MPVTCRELDAQGVFAVTLHSQVSRNVAFLDGKATWIVALFYASTAKRLFGSQLFGLALLPHELELALLGFVGC